MKDLKHLLPSEWNSRFWIGLAGFIGFADASYLTILSYSGSIPPCRIVSGCEEVLTSSFSRIWGVPVSLFGAIFYASILLLLGFYLSKPSQKTRNLLRLLAGAGMAATGYFLYLQAFVLETWCTYCLISAGTSLSIFLASFWFNSVE